MKTRPSTAWDLGLALAAAFSISASAQRNMNAGSALSQPAALGATSHVMAATTSSSSEASAAAPIPKPRSAAVSPWFTDIVKLTRAGIGPQALLAFIDSAGTFNLEANQVIYLRDLGAPSELITAMLQHDADIASGVLPLPVTAVPKLPPPFKTIAVVTNTTPAVAVAKAPPTPATAIAQAVTPQEDDQEMLYPEDLPAEAYETAASPGFSPVRKPYPVQLLDPIVVVRAPERVPNVISIRMLP